LLNINKNDSKEDKAKKQSHNSNMEIFKYNQSATIYHSSTFYLPTFADFKVDLYIK